MITQPSWEIWAVIVGLGVGSFAMRFSFLGLVGDRNLPPWFLRHLRYTAVAVLPGLVAPAVIWPAATGGDPDPARLSAALMTCVAGYYSRNVMIAVIAGALTLYGMLWLLG
ncbi:MAG: AzlD domain-containing protein [Pseudomonadota bacterium]